MERTLIHQLLDIMAIVLLVGLAGTDSWVAIETYGNAKCGWLATLLACRTGFPRTIPSPLCLLDSDAFKASFQQWVKVLAIS